MGKMGRNKTVGSRGEWEIEWRQTLPRAASASLAHASGWCEYGRGHADAGRVAPASLTLRVGVDWVETLRRGKEVAHDWMSDDLLLFTCADSEGVSIQQVTRETVRFPHEFLEPEPRPGNIERPHTFLVSLFHSLPESLS
jgi:hypothetical protein